MSCQANYFCPIKSGTTFNGKEITLYNGTGDAKTPFDLTGYDISIKFRTSKNASDFVFEFSTLDDTIVITDPLTGAFMMQPRLMDYKAMEYYYDIVLTSSVRVWSILSNKWLIE